MGAAGYVCIQSVQCGVERVIILGYCTDKQLEESYLGCYLCFPCHRRAPIKNFFMGAAVFVVYKNWAI